MLAYGLADIVSGPASATPDPNNPATGQPTISGTAQAGETLTANTSGIADRDGLNNATFIYQWLADDSDISGATGSTYTLVDGDVGQAIKVRVTFTDDRGHAEEVTSKATAQVTAAPNNPATGQPTISGTAQAGETLTANTSGIADRDGLDSAVFSYQWLADDAAIANATGSTYTLVDDDVGQAIKVRVSFTDDRGHAEEVTSDATAQVAAALAPEPAPNNPATGQPTISGTVQAGQTLTADTSAIADTDGLNNAVFSYQWLSDDATIANATTGELSGHGPAHHQRHGPGGGDADGECLGHRRPGRLKQRRVQLPVAGRRFRHRRGHRLDLHP